MAGWAGMQGQYCLTPDRWLAGTGEHSERQLADNEREYTGSGTRHSWGLQIDDLHDHQSAGSVGALDWQVGLQVMR